MNVALHKPSQQSSEHTFRAPASRAVKISIKEKVVHTQRTENLVSQHGGVLTWRMHIILTTLSSTTEQVGSKYTKDYDLLLEKMR